MDDPLRILQVPAFAPKLHRLVAVRAEREDLHQRPDAKRLPDAPPYQDPSQSRPKGRRDSGEWLRHREVGRARCEHPDVSLLESGERSGDIRRVDSETASDPVDAGRSPVSMMCQ